MERGELSEEHSKQNESGERLRAEKQVFEHLADSIGEQIEKSQTDLEKAQEQNDKGMIVGSTYQIMALRRIQALFDTLAGNVNQSSADREKTFDTLVTNPKKLVVGKDTEARPSRLGTNQVKEKNYRDNLYIGLQDVIRQTRAELSKIEDSDAESTALVKTINDIESFLKRNNFS